MKRSFYSLVLSGNIKDLICYWKQCRFYNNEPQTSNLKHQILVAGEFYEDEKPYQEQIEKLGIKDQLILRTDFIPDSEVKYYFCAADAVIQPYRNATQSGVTPLAYHFEKPMIVTNVGGLPSLVPNEKAGLVVEPDPASYCTRNPKILPIRRKLFYSSSSQRKTKI